MVQHEPSVFGLIDSSEVRACSCLKHYQSRNEDRSSNLILLVGTALMETVCGCLSMHLMAGVLCILMCRACAALYAVHLPHPAKY